MTLVSRVQEVLEAANGEAVYTASLASDLGLEVSQVRQAVANLRRRGVEVERADRGAYRLAPADDPVPPKRRRRPAQVPHLGERLQVVAMALERGQVVLRLAGADQAWSAVLRAEVDPEGSTSD